MIKQVIRHDPCIGTVAIEDIDHTDTVECTMRMVSHDDAWPFFGDVAQRRFRHGDIDTDLIKRAAGKTRGIEVVRDGGIDFVQSIETQRAIDHASGGIAQRAQPGRQMRRDGEMMAVDFRPGIGHCVNSLSACRVRIDRPPGLLLNTERHRD